MEEKSSPRGRCPNCERPIDSAAPVCLHCGASLIPFPDPELEELVAQLQADPVPQPTAPPEGERQAVLAASILPELPAAEQQEGLTVLPASPEALAADRLQAPTGDLVLPGPGFWAAVAWCLVALLGPVLAGCWLGLVLAFRLPAQGQPEMLRLFVVSSSVVYAAFMLAIVGLNLRSRTQRVLALRGMNGLHFFLVLLLVLPTLVLSDEIAIRAAHGLDATFAPRGQVSVGAAGLARAGVATRLFDSEFDTLARLPWPLLLLLGCLLPGVVEEVFFRGFLGRGLVARFGAVTGTLLTSLLFALVHIDPVQIVYTMVLGVILHHVFLTTRSLLGPVVLHTLYNTLGLSRMKLQLEGAILFTGLSDELTIPLPLAAAALAAVLLLCWLLYRTRSQWVLPDGRDWSPGYVTSEMHALGLAVPSRHPLRLGPTFLTTGACLVFGVFFAQALTGWLNQSAILVRVRHAEALVEKGEHDQAVAACNEAIRLDPRQAFAYLVRGEAYRMKGLYPQSLADLGTALQLDPTNARAHASRGETFRLLGSHDRALESCNRALQLDRRLAWGYTIRGMVHHDQKDYARAIVDWDESLRLEPSHTWTTTRLAWTLATCPEGRHRRGQRAVIVARRACDLTEWKDEEALSALAAAYAESGEFLQAVIWQEKAVPLASVERKEFCSALLQRFRAGQPYRAE